MYLADTLAFMQASQYKIKDTITKKIINSKKKIHDTIHIYNRQ